MFESYYWLSVIDNLMYMYLYINNGFEILFDIEPIFEKKLLVVPI